jgi:steroid 5-alpha reductase family enzyme
MPDARALWPAALVGLACIVGLALLTWLLSLRQRDASLADRAWPAFIGAGALVYAAMWPALSARGVAMTLLTLAWALRLGIYITLRNRGHREDRRYQQMRQRHGPRFWIKSLYLVFGLQSLLGWIVTAPLLVGMAGTRAWGWLDGVGAALAAFGIVYEALADAQLARFKAEPDQHGRVMDRGLWRYSRHPNYFGEFCVWWGLWLLAVAGAGWASAWAVVSPALMTVLLLRVSGVTLLESTLRERRPAYGGYIARTNAFFPGPVHQEPS